MKTFVIAMMAIALFAGVALADSKAAPEKPEVESHLLANLTEIEPNNTAATANPITGGDVYTAALSPAADQDWFSFATTGGNSIFETSAGASPAAGDTKIYVYASDGTTQVAFDDDSGAGLYSLVNYNFAAGTYYVKVVHYSATGTGNYKLACTVPQPPQPNDVCGGAIDIQDQSLSSWTVNLTTSGGYTNNYSPAVPSCTGYSANGPDALYKINLAAGEQVIISELGDCDTSIWIASDCANLNTTCVAGADAVGGFSAETVTYTATAAGTYFVVIDAYATGGCPVTVTVNAPVATDASSFGALKAMFR